MPTGTADMKDPPLSATESMDLKNPTGQGKVILFNSSDDYSAKAEDA
jgi:hypothetical protein